MQQNCEGVSGGLPELLQDIETTGVLEEAMGEGEAVGTELKPCPVCGGWWRKPDPDPNLATPDYVCVLCETQLWLTDEQRHLQNIIRTKTNEFFFLEHEPREVMPSGPPKKTTGGSRSGKNRNKNKRAWKYYIEPWKLE